MVISFIFYMILGFLVYRIHATIIYWHSTVNDNGYVDFLDDVYLEMDTNNHNQRLVLVAMDFIIWPISIIYSTVLYIKYIN